MGADHKPVLRRAGEAVLEASGQGPSERKIWLNRIKDNFVGTWMLDLGHKGYMCNGLFQAPGVRDWDGREGGGAVSVCGEGRWVQNEAKKWPSPEVKHGNLFQNF